MVKKLRFKYCSVLLLFCLLLFGCNPINDKHEKDLLTEGELNNEKYVASVMSHYPTIFPKDNSHINSTLPGPPNGLFYYTIDATYKADTFAVLLSSLSELIKLSKISGQPIDSVSLISVIKRKTIIPLTLNAFEKAIIVEPISSIDSVKLKGREYFLSYYFTESGTQKKRLSFEEEAYIVDILSNWNIPVDFDDYVGLYSYRKLD